MTGADYLYLVGAIAFWLLVMCVGAAIARLILGPDPDLEGPWWPGDER